MVARYFLGLLCVWCSSWPRDLEVKAPNYPCPQEKSQPIGQLLRYQDLYVACSPLRATGAAGMTCTFKNLLPTNWKTVCVLLIYQKKTKGGHQGIIVEDSDWTGGVERWKNMGINYYMYEHMAKKMEERRFHTKHKKWWRIRDQKNRHYSWTRWLIK